MRNTPSTWPSYLAEDINAIADYFGFNKKKQRDELGVFIHEIARTAFNTGHQSGVESALCSKKSKSTH